MPGTLAPPALAVASSCVALSAVPTLTAAGVFQVIVGVTGEEDVELPPPPPHAPKVETIAERKKAKSTFTGRFMEILCMVTVLSLESHDRLRQTKLKTLIMYQFVLGHRSVVRYSFQIVYSVLVVKARLQYTFTGGVLRNRIPASTGRLRLGQPIFRSRI